MSFRIKTVLHIDGMDYTLPIPQKQKDFDKYLTEAGILTGDRSEYKIAEIECSIPEFNDILEESQYVEDIEELNYFAQLLHGYDDKKLNDYIAIASAKEDITMKGLIDLALKFNDIEIYDYITDTDELGRKYVDDKHPDLDPLIWNNIKYRSLGDDVSRQESGVFSDAGYIKKFNNIFLNPIYDGESFPYYDYEDDYSLKIRLCNGTTTNDSIDEYVDIILPASDDVFARAMRRIKVDNLHDSWISNYYSERFGEDMMKLFAPDENIANLNVLAMKMDQIPKDRTEDYKDAVANELVEGDVDAMIALTDKFMSGEYQKEKTMRDCKEETIRRLTSSAVDMAKALGNDASVDIKALKTQVVNFVNKWNLTEMWIEQFDMDVADAMPEEQPDETEDQESGMGMNMM